MLVAVHRELVDFGTTLSSCVATARGSPTVRSSAALNIETVIRKRVISAVPLLPVKVRSRKASIAAESERQSPGCLRSRSVPSASVLPEHPALWWEALLQDIRFGAGSLGRAGTGREDRR